MLRLTLTPDQRAALEAQRRDSSLTPAELDVADPARREGFDQGSRFFAGG